MKANIHPKMHAVKAHCACGNEFETQATVEELRLEICGACHPFYTGKKRAVQAAGRVQKFEAKYQTSAPAATGATNKAKAVKAKPKKKDKG